MSLFELGLSSERKAVVQQLKLEIMMAYYELSFLLIFFSFTNPPRRGGVYILGIDLIMNNNL